MKMEWIAVLGRETTGLFAVCRKLLGWIESECIITCPTYLVKWELQIVSNF